MSRDISENSKTLYALNARISIKKGQSEVTRFFGQRFKQPLSSFNNRWGIDSPEIGVSGCGFRTPQCIRRLLNEPEYVSFFTKTHTFSTFKAAAQVVA